MIKLIPVLFTAALLAAGSAVADHHVGKEGTKTTMEKGAMTRSGMEQDAMGKGAMKKDESAGGAMMKKEVKKMPAKPGDAMEKGAMEGGH